MPLEGIPASALPPRLVSRSPSFSRKTNCWLTSYGNVPTRGQGTSGASLLGGSLVKQPGETGARGSLTTHLSHSVGLRSHLLDTAVNVGPSPQHLLAARSQPPSRPPALAARPRRPACVAPGPPAPRWAADPVLACVRMAARRRISRMAWLGRLEEGRVGFV